MCFLQTTFLPSRIPLDYLVAYYIDTHVHSLRSKKVKERTAQLLRPSFYKYIEYSHSMSTLKSLCHEYREVFQGVICPSFFCWIFLKYLLHILGLKL